MIYQTKWTRTSLILWASVCIYGLIMTVVRGDEVVNESTACTVSNHPQLFLDDFLIARMKNLRRDVKQPTKDPNNPLIRQDFPWEKRMIELYGTVLYDEVTQKYRCWYLASESSESSPEYIVCYAESEDGIEWQKPFVGEGKLGEHMQHNAVIQGGHGICVLPTPFDPDPNRKFKAVGGDTSGWSADGIHWTTEKCRYAVGKNDTTSSMVYWRGEYLWFVRNQEPETGTSVLDSVSGKKWSGTMRGVGLSVSTDFRTWTPKESILRSDALDRFPWGQPHALCVTPYGDVLIGLLPMLSLYPEDDNNALGPMDVQLAVSRDGRTWQRVAERQVFMPQPKSDPLKKREWDARFHPGSTMLIHDDQVHIYYFGVGRLHGEGRGDGIQVLPPTYGIGRATIDADRFVSLRPMDWLQAGVLETRPLRVSGSELLVNAEAEHGDLQVELADVAGNPLPGFERQASALVSHDKLRHRVTWKDGNGVRSLKEAPQTEPLVLRFSLRNGDLYSFQILK